FFFQAEDGIRDFHVTGVQTCALPIFLGYYETWLMIGVAVAKMGAQHAILRFYPYQDEANGLPGFATNMFLLPLLVSCGIWAVGKIGRASCRERAERSVVAMALMEVAL